MSEVGVKESKELLVGALRLTGLIIKQLKDGADAGDVTAILSYIASDNDFKEAVKGLGEIPKEFKDLSLVEGFELAGVVLKELPALFKQ